MSMLSIWCGWQSKGAVEAEDGMSKTYISTALRRGYCALMLVLSNI